MGGGKQKRKDPDGGGGFEPKRAGGKGRGETGSCQAIFNPSGDLSFRSGKRGATPGGRNTSDTKNTRPLPTPPFTHVFQTRARHRGVGLSAGAERTIIQGSMKEPTEGEKNPRESPASLTQYLNGDGGAEGRKT